MTKMVSFSYVMSDICDALNKINQVENDTRKYRKDTGKLFESELIACDDETYLVKLKFSEK